ncbi:MAG TPA: dihydrofolate reductase [Burkholderiaceae bacterium]|jgi:dihydrofolate reductase|nr:dihydrofolate reductase [Burkholderiaceae bacterium]
MPPPIPGLTIALVAAVARNGVVGHANALPWRLPEDLQHFRALTAGHSVLMGRRTWDSLPARFRPLPGRRNVVLTRQRDWHAPGAIAAHDFDEAIAQAGAPMEDGVDASRVFIVGGAELYAQALPLADELHMTEIERDFDGDAHFPDWPRADFDEVARQRHRAAAPNDFDFAFVTWRRKGPCLA